MKYFLKILTELGKIRISLSVAFSAMTGYILYTGILDNKGWFLAVGIFFMSCSSGALNHWQEREIDAKMPRTKNRPIPSGKISPAFGLWVAICFAATGSIILIISLPLIALILSWTTLFFYNAVYTPLKKVTAFAVIPGSMVGALPPIIGWAAAGGALTSKIILLVSAFFFIGQIPHFWLLLMLFGDQYKMAGLPCLNQVFTQIQIKRVTYVWVLTTVASALLVILYVLSNKLLIFILLFYTFYLLSSLSIAVFMQSDFKVKPAFYKLNFLYLFMMIFLVADSLMRV